MVEPRALDDFKSGDWAGIHYQELKSDGSEGPFLDFPAVISEINTCDSNPRNHYIKVSMLKPCDQEVELDGRRIQPPFRLRIEYISRLARI